MNRKRGNLAIPQEMQTNERLSTKKELAEKERPIHCPQVPVKMRKSGRQQNSTAVPVFYANSVMLSPNYNPKVNESYFEQVFTCHIIVGEGSFGKVYRVKSWEDRKHYAIKRMRSNISFKDRHAEVKNNEIVGSHENCVKFFMAWEENNETYMLLEYCEMSLADYSKLNNDIPEELLWNVLYDMCKALDFLHKRNLLHLDIKPGNIMMKKGFYKLGDFGLLADLHKNDHITKSTLSDGDSKYLAMEVLEGIYTPKCDIFGLGLTILELAADLELPDHGPLWQQLRHGILPSPFYQRATLALRMIVMKMIKLQYDLRPNADKILSYIVLKDVAKRDNKEARVDYAAPYVTFKDTDDAMPLSPLSFNNNNQSTTSTSTPPCRFNPSYHSSDSLFISQPVGDENTFSGGQFSGRKSLFSKIDSKSPFNSSGVSTGTSSGTNDSPMEGTGIERQAESSLLASSLNDSGMESMEILTTDSDIVMSDSIITSTPVLKTRQSRRIPKAKLTFE